MKWLLATVLLSIAATASAQNIPSDALPQGTYRDSCGECKISNGRYLVCRYCKNGRNKVSGALGPILGGEWESGVSLDLKACPDGPVWNDRGQLRCGNG